MIPHDEIARIYNLPGQESDVKKDLLAARTNFTSDLVLSELPPPVEETHVIVKKVEVPEGLSETMGLLFVLANVLGSGVIFLPEALSKTGWFGVFLLTLCASYTLYSSLCLGWCWLIMEERWEQYRTPQRSPYSSIGYMVGGRYLQYFVSFCFVTSTIGSAAVLISVLANQLVALLPPHGLPYCCWIIIIPVLFVPTLFPATARELKSVAVTSIITLILSISMIIIAIIVNKQESAKVHYHKESYTGIWGVFGTFLFAFGGSGRFPAIHTHMENKKTFPISIASGYLLIFCLFLPLSIIGYACYGEEMHFNLMEILLRNSENKILVYLMETAHVLFIIHLWCAYVIFLNPAMQELEEYFKIPVYFNIYRCIVRGSASLLIGLVLLAVPALKDFSNVLRSTTMILLMFIFPPLFYMLLVDNSQPSWPERNIGKLERLWLIVTILIGIAGGIITMYAMIQNYSLSELSCFVNMSKVADEVFSISSRKV